MKKFSKNIAALVLLMAFVLPGLTIGTATATATPVQRAPITPSTLSETQSAAIIIAGDRSDHALQNNIMYGADQVYNILINNRGFLPSRVYFLGSRLDAGVNAISTYSNIQYAFQTWAPTVTDASHGLVIYMFDHGGSGAMAIPGGQLNAPDINTWLNALPTSRIIIVYEACESGSFIPYLSAPNRIVIASTDPADSAYASSNWAYFSESFWGSIATGTDIGNSFVSGIYNIARNGHYSDYIPLIDDNHDSVGHTAQNVLVVIFPVLFLPNGGDGNDALNTLIQGYGGSLFVPIVHFHIPIYYLDTGGNGINIHINSVTNNTPVHFFVRAIAPTWKPTPPANNTVMGQDTGPGMYLLNITRNVDGAYVGTIPSGGGPFSQGAYNISIYAMTSAGISGQVFTQDYVNANGSAPTERTPPAVAITMPQNGSISGNVNVTAIGDDRLGLNRIELYVDGALMKNVTMPAYRPYPAATFLLNSTSLSNGDHTILAKAYNTAGLSSTSTVVVKVQNGATSGFLPVIVIGAAIAGIAWIASRRKRSGVIAQ